jgi:hypothetical protein
MNSGVWRAEATQRNLVAACRETKGRQHQRAEPFLNVGRIDLRQRRS